MLEVLTKEKKFDNMDKIFEDYIGANKDKDSTINNISNINNETKVSNPTYNSNLMDIDIFTTTDIENIENIKNIENKNIIFNKTRIEILNIIFIILNNLNEIKYISNELLSFLTKIVELYINHKETINTNTNNKDSQEIRAKVLNLLNFIQISYKKSIPWSSDNINHNKIIYIHMMKFCLHKALESSNDSDGNNSKDESSSTSTNKKSYLDFFIKQFLDLNSNENVPLINLIVSYTKGVIYKTIDNKSFKNPILM